MSDDSNLVQNRRARHDYEILETFDAGMCLKGTEIKSLRMHDVHLNEAYVKILKGEVYLIGAYIGPYKFGNIHNHEERRDRKLLLHKREIATLSKGTQEKGLTIVPLKMFLSRGRAKLQIGLAKGKKTVDKRQTIKEREAKKEIQRKLKDI